MLQILLQGVTHSDIMIKSQQQTLKELQELKTMLRNSQEIPPQVLLSTPVVLLDACGRIAPFHLEFIDSAEVSVFIFSISIAGIVDNVSAGASCGIEDSLQDHWLAED